MLSYFSLPNRSFGAVEADSARPGHACNMKGGDLSAMIEQPINRIPSLAIGLAWTLTVTVLCLTLLPIASSLWLDECATAWLVQGSPSEILDKSMILLQPPIPVFATALSAKLFGGGEIALRLPSAVGAIMAVMVVFRTATELVGGAAAWPSIAFLVCLPYFRFMAVDTRPYPLALCAASAALLFLGRAVRTGEARPVYLLALSLAAAVHVHLLFVYFLAVAALAALLFVHGPEWRTWVRAAALTLALIAPLLPYYRRMFSWSSGMSWMAAPTFESLFQTLVPVFPLAFFFVGTAVGIVISRDATIDTSGLRGRGFAIAAAALIVPVGLLYVISMLSDTKLFLHRYLTPAIPGLCMTWGALIAGLRPARISSSAVIVALLVVGGEGLYNVNWEHNNEDWRGALRRARDLGKEGTPGLAVYSGFIESRSLAMLRKKSQRAQILSPLAAYPVGIDPVVAMPYDVGADATTHWDSTLRNELGAVTNLIVVLRGSHSSPEWEQRLMQTLPGSGFRQTRREEYGTPKGVVVLQFLRQR